MSSQTLSTGFVRLNMPVMNGVKLQQHDVQHIWLLKDGAMRCLLTADFRYQLCVGGPAAVPALCSSGADTDCTYIMAWLCRLRQI